jgi:hypothetical protein
MDPLQRPLLLLNLQISEPANTGAALAKITISG